MNFWRKTAAILVPAALLLVWLPATVSGLPNGDYPNGLCTLDDDQTNEHLEKCFGHGEKFLGKYLDNIRRGKDADLCSLSREFRDCLEDLSDACPTIRHHWHLHWFDIYDKIKSACLDDQEFGEQMRCFQYQYDSILTRRCDAYYKFNKKQKTRHLCHFLHENIRCKESLMTSGCGNDTGQFAFHVFKVLDNKAIAKHRCAISREVPYKGFAYNKQCPSDFHKALETCDTEHIASKLEFHEDNDLVVNGKKSDLRRACGEFREYKRCVRPIEEACPRGADVIEQYDGKSRTYILKLQYICEEHKKVYMDNLRCYKDVLRNETLSKCNSIWDSLLPMLDAVSAHRFYCMTTYNDTKLLQRTLRELVQCYEEGFTQGCGTEGGHVMGGLMTRAFQDPRYLWYKYRPDCELHAQPGETSSAGTEPAMQEQPQEADVTVRPTAETQTHSHHKPHKPKHKNKENKTQAKMSTYSSGVWLRPAGYLVLLLQCVVYLYSCR